jgi:uncharacterized protein
MRLRIFIFLLAISLSATAQENDKEENHFEMKEYYLVFLKQGSAEIKDTAVLAQLMKGHLAHLTRMYDEGKMSLCGPLGVENELRGICVYHIDDIDEVRRLAESDPAVKAGRLRVEVYPWYSAKGMTLK